MKRYIFIILLSMFMTGVIGCAGGHNRTPLHMSVGTSVVKNEMPAVSEPQSSQIPDQPELVAGNVDEFEEYMAKMNAPGGITAEDIPGDENDSRPVATPAASSPPATGGHAKPPAFINSSAVWNEINFLKSRVTLIEGRIDSSPEIKKGIILNFEKGKSELSGGIKAALKKLVTDSASGKISEIAIGIHTDAGTGSQKRNNELTVQRKANVKAFLAENGLTVGEESITGRITSDVGLASLIIIYSVK